MKSSSSTMGFVVLIAITTFMFGVMWTVNIRMSNQSVDQQSSNFRNAHSNLEEIHLNGQTASTVVGLIIVEDANFKGDNEVSLRHLSMYCYARQHGYEFVIIDPNDYHRECHTHGGRHFFYRKHCVVSHWLATKPHGYTAVVLDGDIVAGASPRSLSTWLDSEPDTDVIFFEREWTYEVTSGGYIARNTEFARSFLLQWADLGIFYPKGFHSYDNGAIHVALLTRIGFRDSQKCVDMYYAITNSVNDLSQYFDFVGCVRAVMGPSRRWIIPGKGGLGGRITILPRWTAFMIDHYFYEGRETYHPFHHGVKDNNIVLKKYFTVNETLLKTMSQSTFRQHQDSLRNSTICNLNYVQPEDKLIDPVESPMNQELDCTKTGAMNSDMHRVPRWPQLSCLHGMSCKPLENDDLVLESPVGLQGKLIGKDVIPYLGGKPIRGYEL